MRWETVERECPCVRLSYHGLCGSSKAKEIFARSYGWAVFDNLKIGIGISGGGGNGVAVVKSTNARTYMKMGTVGVGLTLGAQKYQVVFLIQDSKTLSALFLAFQSGLL